MELPLLLPAATFVSLMLGATVARSGEAEQDFLSGLSAFRSGNYELAKRAWSHLGEQGDPRSEAGLAFMFFVGAGTTIDDAKAFYWARLAAERGQPEAQMTLGRLYLDGRAVQKSAIMAFAWCETAQMGGSGGSCREAALLRMTYEEMLVAFRESAKLQSRLRGAARPTGP